MGGNYLWFFECMGTSLLNANLGLTDNVFVAVFEVLMVVLSLVSLAVCV